MGGGRALIRRPFLGNCTSHIGHFVNYIAGIPLKIPCDSFSFPRQHDESFQSSRLNERCFKHSPCTFRGFVWENLVNFLSCWDTFSLRINPIRPRVFDALASLGGGLLRTPNLLLFWTN